MMKKKRILIVSSAFYPEISPRSYRSTELTKEFCRQGHTVTVISKFRNHNYTDFLVNFSIVLKMWDEPILPFIPEYKDKLFSYLFRVLKRTLLMLFEYPDIEEMFQVKRMLRSESGYDQMISFAVPYPVHWGVAWSRTKTHLIAGTWVTDCGDPYMGDVLDSFRHPFYFKYIEKWFCKKADFITIPIESARPGYYPEFYHKIRIIPQGFDFELHKKEPENNTHDLPTFAYAGSFLPGARDPKPLLNYLLTLNLPYRFVIFTNKHDCLNEYKEKLNDKLIISNYIPRDELMKILTKMDFLINFDNNTTLNSPSKLIDYVIANRPVLNISQNFKGEELLAFINGDYSKRMLLPNRENYHINNISLRFLQLFNE